MRAPPCKLAERRLPTLGVGQLGQHERVGQLGRLRRWRPLRLERSHDLYPAATVPLAQQEELHASLQRWEAPAQR